MKQLVFALLCSVSLSACAQSSTPQATDGQKIGVGSNAPTATKPPTAHNPMFQPSIAIAPLPRSPRSIPERTRPTRSFHLT